MLYQLVTSVTDRAGRADRVIATSGARKAEIAAQACDLFASSLLSRPSLTFVQRRCQLVWWRAAPDAAEERQPAWAGEMARIGA